MPQDLKTLRERLLTTVAQSSAQLGREGDKPRRKAALADRPLLTRWRQLVDSL